MSAQHAAHDLRLLRSGVALFAALIQAIDRAQHEVLLETYIFDFEGAGGDVARAMMAAAQRGRHNALIRMGDHVLVSASPELFFDVRGSTLQSRPMKGTIRRDVSISVSPMIPLSMNWISMICLPS